MLSATAATVVAVCVLAAVVAAVAGGAWIAARPLGFGPIEAALFGLNYVMARVLWRADARGPLPVEPGRGAVIVCNHRGPYDPSYFYLATHRVIHWMVAAEYFRYPFLAWFLRTARSIPVKRGSIDTGAIKEAVGYLKRGEIVGLFPEGRINATDRLLLRVHSGAAVLAIRAGVPVIPCYVSGSPYDGTSWGFLFMAAKVRLEVGRPIEPQPFRDQANRRQAVEALTLACWREIARLAKAAEGGIRPML